MTRPIKFRVWCKQYNSFKQPNEPMLAIASLSGEFFGIEDGQYAPLRKENYDLQQFTGLKDCVGKEVYEGDILKNVGDLSEHTDTFWEVYFNDGCFLMKTKNQIGTTTYKVIPASYRIRVISNIYESPELLK